MASTRQPCAMPQPKRAASRTALTALGLAVAATWAGLRGFGPSARLAAAESDVAFISLNPEKPGSRPLLDEDAPPEAEDKVKLKKGEETEEMQFDRVKKTVKRIKRLKGKFWPVGQKPWDKPRFMKVIIVVRLDSKQAANTKIMNQVIEELRRISGKHPYVIKAKMNVATTGWRKGADCGAAVNLHGNLMRDFMERLNTITLPRIRDFEGLVPNSFDGRGNFWMRIWNQEPFKELDEMIDERELVHSFDIGIVNSCYTQPDGLKLMKDYGFPFDDPRPPRKKKVPHWKRRFHIPKKK